MKTVWKWVIGILAVLVVLAVLFGVGFMLRSNFHVTRLAGPDVRSFSDRSPGMMPYNQNEQLRLPGMMPFNGYQHMRGPGMMGYRMHPFIGLLGWIFCLGFLGLAVLGIIWLVNRLRIPARVAMAAAPVAMSAEVPVTDATEVVNPCQRCGRSLQDEWKVCPHCGKKV